MRINRRQLKKRSLQVENPPVVVLLDNNILVKSRIRNILGDQCVKIYEAASRAELLRILSVTSKVDLIVTEIEIDSRTGFNGIDLLQLMKDRNSGTHVVVLSSVEKKEVITRCLLEGAADYILKPFEDEYLKKKLLKCIHLKNLTESTVLQFNLKNYLDSEIYKAKKGDYCFSLLKIQFASGDDNGSGDTKHGFYRYEDIIYREMKSLFWESDLYIRLGQQCHLGFFPFCTRDHAEVIIHKIKSGFERIKSAEPAIRDYSITHAFVTYPADGKTTSELLNNLSAHS